MSITNDNQAALNNGTAIDSPRTVVRGSKNHSSPAAHIGPLTPAQSQLQSVVVAGDCPQNADFCPEYAPIGTGAPQPEPGTPGSALCERFMDQTHAIDAGSKQNGITMDRLDTLSHGRANGDETIALQPIVHHLNENSVLQPASIGEQRRTSPGATQVAALCGPESITSPNVIAPNAQPSPLAIAGGAALPTHSRPQQRTTTAGNGGGNGPVRPAAPNWPGPERTPILVFTSQLANDAVSVVYSGGYRSLVEFHMQRVGHRFIQPPAGPKGPIGSPECAGPRFLGPPKPACGTGPGCTDCLTKQPFPVPPGPAHGPGRPNAGYAMPNTGAQPTGTNDKSERVAEWIAAQHDASQDEILKQRSAKMAKLEELKRTLKLGEETGSTPQVPPPSDGNVKTELIASAPTGFAGLPSQPTGQRIPAAPDALQPQTAPGPEWTESKAEVVDMKLSELKPELDAGSLQSQIQVPFTRPQSAPSAGPSPSPAAQSIQSPGSLNEANLAHPSSAPIPATSKRRQSTTGNSQAADKSESQPKPKRRKNTQRSNAAEPSVDNSMPPPPSNLEMQVKSPGCYGPVRPNASTIPIGPGSDMVPGSVSSARRGNSVGPATPGDSVSTLTSKSLSKLAEMTYSMYATPQNQGNTNGMNGMPLPPAARFNEEQARSFPAPPLTQQPGPPYDTAPRMMRPPLDAYPMMNRPAPNGTQPLPGTNGTAQPTAGNMLNAHASMQQQMNMQYAPPGAGFMQMPSELPNIASAGILNVPQSSIVRGPPVSQPTPTMQPPPAQTQNRFGPPVGVNAFDSGNANNANVQIQPKTPNTIQYRPLHPERPQRADNGEVRVPDFRGPQAGPPMQDLSKMGHSPGKLLPMSMSGNDGRFPLPSNMMNNGAPPPVPAGFARPTHMNNGPYVPMNTVGVGMQQAPPGMANMHELGVNSPSAYDFAYRQASAQQQLASGGGPPQPNVASPMFNQYAPNAGPIRAPAGGGIQQQDASIMNMSGPQQGMKVGPNVFVHSLGQVTAQAQSEAQQNLQMQMNAPTQAPQAGFGAQQAGPPQAEPCADLNEEDVYFDLLETCNGGLGSFTGSGNNPAAPAGGFFNPAGTPNMLEDVMLLDQQYANGAPPSASGMMQQPTPVGPQSVNNMQMNVNMGMQQGVLRPPAHEMFNANRFAPAYANPNMGMNAGGSMQPGAIPPNAMQPGNMQSGAMPPGTMQGAMPLGAMQAGAMPPGAMQAGVLQGGLVRFRRPAPPGMPLDMQMQPGGAMMMGMPMMAEQPSVFDQSSQHFYR